eukprot:1161746-Pelagomonas_calceolata.AAC.6
MQEWMRGTSLGACSSGRGLDTANPQHSVTSKMMNMCHAGMDKRDPSQSLLSREGIETANPKLLRLAYE